MGVVAVYQGQSSLWEVSFFLKQSFVNIGGFLSTVVVGVVAVYQGQSSLWEVSFFLKQSFVNIGGFLSTEFRFQ